MQDDETEIRKLIETWMSATKAGDTETVFGLMTDDVVFLVAGRRPFGKEEFQKQSEELAKSSIRFDGKSEILELRVIGEWAYTITKLSVSTTEPGEPATTRSGNTLTIFNKQNGKWLLARDANLLTPDSA